MACLILGSRAPGRKSMKGAWKVMDRPRSARRSAVFRKSDRPEAVKVEVVEADLRIDALPDHQGQQFVPEEVKGYVNLDFFQYLPHSFSPLPSAVLFYHKPPLFTTAISP